MYKNKYLKYKKKYLDLKNQQKINKYVGGKLTKIGEGNKNMFENIMKNATRKRNILLESSKQKTTEILMKYKYLEKIENEKSFDQVENIKKDILKLQEEKKLFDNKQQYFNKIIYLCNYAINNEYLLENIRFIDNEKKCYGIKDDKNIVNAPITYIELMCNKIPIENKNYYIHIRKESYNILLENFKVFENNPLNIRQATIIKEWLKLFNSCKCPAESWSEAFMEGYKNLPSMKTITSSMPSMPSMSFWSSKNKENNITKSLIDNNEKIKKLEKSLKIMNEPYQKNKNPNLKMLIERTQKQIEELQKKESKKLEKEEIKKIQDEFDTMDELNEDILGKFNLKKN